MLWHNDQLWFIDVSQSIEPTHPRALEFLARDCENVVNFFNKSGVTGVMSVKELFNHVSGLEISGQNEDFLTQVCFSFFHFLKFFSFSDSFFHFLTFLLLDFISHANSPLHTYRLTH